MTAMAPIHELPAAKRNASYVGEATVDSVLGGHALMVSLPSAAVIEAKIATSLPHVFGVGDRVVLVGKGSAYYVIALAKPRSKTTLEVEGDIHLEALGGSVEVVGDKGVSVEAPEVAVHAQDRFTVEAQRLHRTSTETRTEVDGVLRTTTRDSDTAIGAGWYTKAQSVVLKVKKAFRFRGKAVHLG